MGLSIKSNLVGIRKRWWFGFNSNYRKHASYWDTLPDDWVMTTEKYMAFHWLLIIFSGDWAGDTAQDDFQSSDEFPNLHSILLVWKGNPPPWFRSKLFQILAAAWRQILVETAKTCFLGVFFHLSSVTLVTMAVKALCAQENTKTPGSAYQRVHTCMRVMPRKNTHADIQRESKANSKVWLCCLVGKLVPTFTLKTVKTNV